MKRCLFIIVLLIIFEGLFSKPKKDFPRNYFSTHLMPLSAFDSRPRLRFGIESRDEDIGFCFDMGLGNYNSFKWYDDFFGLSWYYSIFEMRAEIKKYAKKVSDQFYIGTELFFIQKLDVINAGVYLPSNSNKAYSFSYADYKINKFGAHFKLGFTPIVKNTIIFDFYIGLGIAMRNVSYSNVKNKIESSYVVNPSLFNHAGIEGAIILPHFTLGMKIGLILIKD